MKKNFSNKYLITTGLKKTQYTNIKDNILYLGHWCFNYNQEVEQDRECEIQNYHWEDFKKVINDNIYLEKIYDIILNDLVLKLNNLHKVNNNKRYWEIYLNPWLHQVIFVLYDRWYSIKKAYKDYNIIDTEIINYKKLNLTPYNSQHFKQGISGNSHEWNHFIFSEIIKFLNLPHTVVENDLNFNVHKKFQRKTKHIVLNNSKNKKKFIKNYLLKFLNKFFKSNSALILVNYFSTYEELLFQFKLKQFFVFREDIHDYHIGVTPNDKIRQKILLNFCNKNKDDDFLKFLNEIFIYLIPTSIIEDYNNYTKKINFKNFPRNPKFIYTTTGHYTSTKLKHYIGINNCPLYISQHGATYGTTLFSAAEKYERKISNKFFTWGWKSDNKDVPYVNVKNLTNKKIKNNNSGELLFITCVVSLYPNNLFTNLFSSTWKKNCNDSLVFYKNLPNNIKQQFLVRCSPNDLEWSNEEKRWLDVDKNINFAINNKIEYHYKHCRLAIINHDGTPFLECMSYDYPVIQILKNEYEPLRSSAKEVYNDLKKAKIFFTDYDDARNHIISIWNDIDSWWNNEETIKAKKKYIENYSRNSKSYLDEFIENIN